MALPVGSAGVGVQGLGPTVEELNGITTLAHALAWPGISDGLRDALFDILGTPTVIRDLAFVGLDDWESALSTVAIKLGTVDPANTRAVNGIERGKLVSCRRVCRLRVGLTPGDPEPNLGPAPSQSIGQHAMGSQWLADQRLC